MKQYLPPHSDIIREAVVVMVGALIASFVVRQLPSKYQGLFSVTPVQGVGSGGSAPVATDTAPLGPVSAFTPNKYRVTEAGRFVPPSDPNNLRK